MIRPLPTLACLLLLAPSLLAADPPRVVRENIEWLDVWVPENNTPSLPRVLLVGDSITRGYYREVDQKLKGKAAVSRLATSKSLGDPGLMAEVRLVLGQTKFDVIHFNNGLHGWGYTEDEYAKALPELIALLREGAPGAKLIWATTTPVRTADKLDEVSDRTARVKARNRIAAARMTDEKIPTDDLFTLVEQHPEWYSRDGVHFNAKGITALGEQVTKHVLAVLEAKK